MNPDDSAALIAMVAGALSTFPPHDAEHPDKCIPMAAAVIALLAPYFVEEVASYTGNGDRLTVVVRFPVEVTLFCELLDVIGKYRPGLSIDTASRPEGWYVEVPPSSPPPRPSNGEAKS